MKETLGLLYCTNHAFLISTGNRRCKAQDVNRLVRSLFFVSNSESWILTVDVLCVYNRNDGRADLIHQKSDQKLCIRQRIVLHENLTKWVEYETRRLSNNLLHNNSNRSRQQCM